MSVPEYRQEYLAVVDRVSAMARAVPERLAVPVRACPAWHARDMLGHLTGIAEDWVSGRLHDYASDEWTAAQVARHTDHDLDTLLAAWQRAAGRLDAITHPTMGAPWRWLFGDALAHEGDLREVLTPGTPPPDDAVALALPAIIARWRHHLRDLELPSLQLRVAGLRDWWVGEPAEAQLSLDVDPYELWRFLYGRTSRNDVLAFAWSADPTAHLDPGLPYPFVFADTG